MLKDGAIIAAIGMSVVFTFLFILVVAMSLMAKVMKGLNKYYPEMVEEKKKPAIEKAPDDAEIEVAIAIAATRLV